MISPRGLSRRSQSAHWVGPSRRGIGRVTNGVQQRMSRNPICLTA
jgi:hypothetical protein